MQLECNEDRQTHAKSLLTKLNSLNIYPINILHFMLLFVYKVKNDLAPRVIDIHFDSWPSLPYHFPRYSLIKTKVCRYSLIKKAYH